VLDCFKWCVCCGVVMAMQFALSPITTIAAEVQTGVAVPKTAPSANLNPSEPPVQNIPPKAGDNAKDSLPPLKVEVVQQPADAGIAPEKQNPTESTGKSSAAEPATNLNPSEPVQSISPKAGDNAKDSLPPQKVEVVQQPADVGIAPEKQNLTGLTGKSEISVMVDADGEFTRSLAENRISEEEPAKQIDETNLLESIGAGRSFSRDSLAAQARTNQAKAQTGQALALLLPSVSVHANYGLENSQPSVLLDALGTAIPSDTHERADYAFSARQPLFDLPAFLDWRRRKVIEQARGENYRTTDGDAYLSAVNAYLSLVSGRLQIDMIRDFEAQLENLYTYIEKRTKAGASSVSDMARVRARREATLSSRLEQEAALAAAGIEFVRLTNIAPRKVRLPVLEDVGASLLPKTFSLAVSTAMKYNPEIAGLADELRAANIDTSAAKGRYLPRVSAEYTDTYSNHAGGAAYSQKDKRLMVVLDWNLFSGGGDYQIVQERKARERELLYRLDDQRRRVVQTLSANYATLAATTERIASGYQELKSITTAADAMSQRMLSGNQSLLDLLDVYDQLYQARSRLVTLHVLELSTVAQLVRITVGAPWGASEVNAEPRLKVGYTARQ
jgi:adhesin transport system outer membrane protein